MKNAGLGIVAALTPLVLGGCIDSNARTRLGDSVDLPAFSEAEVTPLRAEPKASRVATVKGLDRSHWAPVEVVAPVDGVAYRPTYATDDPTHQNTARARGEQPTPRGSLELAGEGKQDQLLEAARAAGNAVVDVAMLPYRFYKQRPWRTESRGVEQSYWRAPASELRGVEAPESTK
jgi:hypothetical protein